jgi:hypothetical protein
MSLATDSIFIRALQSSDELMELLRYSVDGDDIIIDESPRLYGTSIPLPDEDAENVPVPYIIVTFDGLTNDQGSKDDRYESDYDTVNIGVEVTARTLDDLHTLTQMVRTTILSYLRENETGIEEYQFAAQQIQYDQMKPCYWQTLTYQCDVNNAYEYEQAEKAEGAAGNPVGRAS